MEFQVNAAGKRIYPAEFKRQVLEELRGGATVPELARKYGVAVQNIFHWRKAEELAVLGKSKGPKPEEMVPLSEYKRLYEENQKLRKSLANMTLDRDILKEAVDIGVKKKWISPGK